MAKGKGIMPKNISEITDFSTPCKNYRADIGNYFFREPTMTNPIAIADYFEVTIAYLV